MGSGPNGLAAALVLAAAGLRVEVLEAADEAGGGARTAELTGDGVLHDVCSAVHPLALASPFFRALDLARHGVALLQPEAAFAHPLDDGTAAIAWRDLDRTAEGLGVDGGAWRRLLGPLTARWPQVVALALGDTRSLPLDVRSLQAALALGAGVASQSGPWWDLPFRGAAAPALLTGAAAHPISPPRATVPAATGLLLTTLAHGVGWPVVRGGTQRITDAMIALLQSRGGRVRTGVDVRSYADLPPARALLLDVAPAGLLRIAGDRLPSGYAAWLRRFRYGGAACKVDLVLSAPAPWTAPDARLAGTLHLGGTRGQVLDAEREVAAGRHAERPFVLVSQPSVVDASRAPTGRHPLWTYAHVPQGSTRDVSGDVLAQLERFAPGTRDLVVAINVRTASDLERHDANYVGGDIGAGAVTPWQVLARPVPRWDPYRTPLPGTYLCSASTPPGPGVHGMAGLHAASRVLRSVFGDRRDPLALLASLAPAAR